MRVAIFSDHIFQAKHWLTRVTVGVAVCAVRQHSLSGHGWRLQTPVPTSYMPDHTLSHAGHARSHRDVSSLGVPFFSPVQGHHRHGQTALGLLLRKAGSSERLTTATGQ